MKKIFCFLLVIGCLFIFGGCKKEESLKFSYFESAINNIDNYKSYNVSQEIYSDDLLLYDLDKNVYLYDGKYKMVVNTKEINDYSSSSLYSVIEEEYYFYENNIYYKESDVWKVREGENSELGVELSISEDFFESYNIKEENNDRFLTGVLKKDKINEFLGVDISSSNNVVFSVIISNKDRVKEIKLEYLTVNNNKVSIVMSIDYSQNIIFSLPSIG